MSDPKNQQQRQNGNGSTDKLADSTEGVWGPLRAAPTNNRDTLQETGGDFVDRDSSDVDPQL